MSKLPNFLNGILSAIPNWISEEVDENRDGPLFSEVSGDFYHLKTRKSSGSLMQDYIFNKSVTDLNKKDLLSEKQLKGHLGGSVS